MKDKFEIYMVSKKDTIKRVLQVFQFASDNSLPTGIAVVVDRDNCVEGVISEGDIRRAFIDGKTLDDEISNVYNKNPVCVNSQLSYKEILTLIPQRLSERNRKSKKFLGNIILSDDNNKFVKVLAYNELWEQKVASHRHVVVLGLGYVGLTLGLVLSDEGFFVTGVDLDIEKISKLKNKQSYVFEKGLPELLREQSGRNFVPSLEIPDDGDVYVISVGTPVSKGKGDKYPTPVLDYIISLSKELGKKLRPGNLVILRSTVPTGTTRNVVIPLLEEYSGLKCGQDFHLSFAPERTAEGKALKELRDLPQIIGGINEDSVEATAALFRELTPTIVKVSSIEAAEMVKLINNSFRDIVFAYSNYVSKIASGYNLDIIEIIKAANQGYPRDPVPLPSPGVGGACLTKDPYIFSTITNTDLSSEISLFEYGRMINESMHNYISDRVISEVAKLGKDITKIKIFVCGLAFKGKPETGDVRNSSAVEIYHLLKCKTKNIFGHDPIASLQEIKDVGVTSVEFQEGIENSDVILFLNNNEFYERLDMFDVVRKMGENPIIVDGWNIFRAEDILNAKPSVYMDLSQIKKSTA
jgi:nucleotide sugar dehydrogenase